MRTLICAYIYINSYTYIRCYTSRNHWTSISTVCWMNEHKTRPWHGPLRIFRNELLEGLQVAATELVPDGLYVKMGSEMRIPTHDLTFPICIGLNSIIDFFMFFHVFLFCCWLWFSFSEFVICGWSQSWSGFVARQLNFYAKTPVRPLRTYEDSARGRDCKGPIWFWRNMTKVFKYLCLFHHISILYLSKLTQVIYGDLEVNKIQRQPTRSKRSTELSTRPCDKDIRNLVAVRILVGGATQVNRNHWTSLVVLKSIDTYRWFAWLFAWFNRILWIALHRWALCTVMETEHFSKHPLQLSILEFPWGVLQFRIVSRYSSNHVCGLSCFRIV